MVVNDKTSTLGGCNLDIMYLESKPLSLRQCCVLCFNIMFLPLADVSKVNKHKHSSMTNHAMSTIKSAKSLWRPAKEQEARTR